MLTLTWQQALMRTCPALPTGGAGAAAGGSAARAPGPHGGGVCGRDGHRAVGEGEVCYGGRVVFGRGACMHACMHAAPGAACERWTPWCAASCPACPGPCHPSPFLRRWHAAFRDNDVVVRGSGLGGAVGACWLVVSKGRRRRASCQQRSCPRASTAARLAAARSACRHDSEPCPARRP